MDDSRVRTPDPAELQARVAQLESMLDANRTLSQKALRERDGALATKRHLEARLAELEGQTLAQAATLQSLRESGVINENTPVRINRPESVVEKKDAVRGGEETPRERNFIPPAPGQESEAAALRVKLEEEKQKRERAEKEIQDLNKRMTDLRIRVESETVARENIKRDRDSAVARVAELEGGGVTRQRDAIDENVRAELAARIQGALVQTTELGNQIADLRQTTVILLHQRVETLAASADKLKAQLEDVARSTEPRKDAPISASTLAAVTRRSGIAKNPTTKQPTPPVAAGGAQENVNASAIRRKEKPSDPAMKRVTQAGFRFELKSTDAKAEEKAAAQVPLPSPMPPVPPPPPPPQSPAQAEERAPMPRQQPPTFILPSPTVILPMDEILKQQQTNPRGTGIHKRLPPEK